MGQHGGFWFGADVDILFTGWPSGHGYFHFFLALILVFILSMFAQIYAMTPMTTPKMVPKSLIQHAALHCFRTFITFLVLLCVITFNLGVLMTSLMGHMAGYVALNLYIHYHYPAPAAAATAAVAALPANDEKA